LIKSHRKILSNNNESWNQLKRVGFGEQEPKARTTNNVQRNPKEKLKQNGFS